MAPWPGYTPAITGRINAAPAGDIYAIWWGAIYGALVAYKIRG